MEILIRKKDIDDFDCLYADRLGIDKDLLSIEDLLGIIEDLYYENERLKEEFEDYKKQVEDNYEPISPYKMYGISERDFH